MAEFLPFASEMAAGLQHSTAMEGGVYQRARHNLRPCAPIDRLLLLLLPSRQGGAPAGAIETESNVLSANLAIISLQMVFVVPDALSARLVDIATIRYARVYVRFARPAAMYESEVRPPADPARLGGRPPELVAQV